MLDAAFVASPVVDAYVDGLRCIVCGDDESVRGHRRSGMHI